MRKKMDWSKSFRDKKEKERLPTKMNIAFST